MKRTLSDSQNNTGFHGKFGKLRRLSVNGGQGSELPTERLTQLCFRQVQVIRIGKNCQTVGKVGHVLMKAPRDLLAVAEFLDDDRDNLRQQDVVLIWAKLLPLQIEPAEQLLFLGGEFDETHAVTAVAGKGGIVHAEIMLPAHAPRSFADRSILWNSVEQIEKARDSQLAREIEAALPRELSGEQQLALVRAYVKDNFVDKGMCADFAIHDKGTGNPHVHIMLTLRPLKENGQWGAKCRKAYDLDENGQRIPDGKGGWKNHREDTTDWNDKENVEIWRAAWAAYTNRALESAGRPERIDHRSYKRQGIDKIPSVHLGPAASQMEKRGIRTDKGEVNRQIVADNKLLKEIKARITRLYRWSKAEAEKPQTQQSSLTALWEAQQQLNAPRTRTGKIRALQESAALFSFLQVNGIQSMQQLHEKIADMNSCYYDLRGKIVKAERRIAILTERGEMWEQYNQYKSIHKQLAKVKPEKREQFEQRHSRELILYDAAARYLKELKDSGEAITPKAWQREIDQLIAGKQTDTLAMKSMREDLKAVERLRKTAKQLSRQERDKSHDRGPER